jgi:hypothetical protein
MRQVLNMKLSYTLAGSTLGALKSCKKAKNFVVFFRRIFDIYIFIGGDIIVMTLHRDCMLTLHRDVHTNMYIPISGSGSGTLQN